MGEINKRFKLIPTNLDEYDLCGVEDTFKLKSLSIEESIDLLNQLNDENEQLKQQIKTLTDAIDRGDFR